jgi:hypothetical protein
MNSRAKVLIATFAVTFAAILGISSFTFFNGKPIILGIAIVLIVGIISWFGSEGLARIGRRNGVRMVKWLSKKTTINNSTADNEMYDDILKDLFSQIDFKQSSKFKKDPIVKALINKYIRENNEPKRNKYYAEIIDYIHSKIV